MAVLVGVSGGAGVRFGGLGWPVGGGTAGGRPPVVEEPSRAIAASGEILVGIGRWATRGASGDGFGT